MDLKHFVKNIYLFGEISLLNIVSRFYLLLKDERNEGDGLKN